MKLSLNGLPRDVQATTLIELLEELQLDVDHVAVELNQKIVEQARFATIVLQEHDSLEVIQFVGGG